MMVLRSGRGDGARLRALALSCGLTSCQWVGGYEPFEMADERASPPHRCDPLPVVRPDDRGLALLVRVDFPSGHCVWLDEREVTVGAYSQWIAAVTDAEIEWDASWCRWKEHRNDPVGDLDDPCRALLDGGDLDPFGERKPIRCVDWCDAQAFCTWAGKRLPLEFSSIGVQGLKSDPREWRAGCTNGFQTESPWGNDLGPDRCNVRLENGLCGTSTGVCGASTVGDFPRCTSQRGADNLLGNVAEWVLACTPTPITSVEPTRCLTLGGGFDEPLRSCSTEYARRMDERRPNLGFRCATDLTADERAVTTGAGR